MLKSDIPALETLAMLALNSCIVLSFVIFLVYPSCIAHEFSRLVVRNYFSAAKFYIFLASLLLSILGCSKSDSSTSDAVNENAGQASQKQDARVIEIRGLLSSKNKSDWTSAQSKAAAYLQASPNDIVPQILYTLSLARTGSTTAAISEARALKASFSNDLRADATLATALLIDKQFQAAINTVNPLLSTHPNNERLHHVLAVGYQQLGNKLKAEEHFNRVREINPQYDGLPVSVAAFAAAAIAWSPVIINLIKSACDLIAAVSMIENQMQAK